MRRTERTLGILAVSCAVLAVSISLSCIYVAYGAIYAFAWSSGVLALLAVCFWVDYENAKTDRKAEKRDARLAVAMRPPAPTGSGKK